MNKKIILFVFFACNMLCASDENRFAFSPSARTEPAGSSGDIPLARNNSNILSKVLTVLCNIYPEFSKDKEEWSLIKDVRDAEREYEMKVSEEKRRLIEECDQFATFDSKTATLDAHYKDNLDNLDPDLIQAIKDDPDLTQDSLVRFAKIHDFELYNKMLKAKEKLDIYMQEKEQEKDYPSGTTSRSITIETIGASSVANHAATTTVLAELPRVA